MLSSLHSCACACAEGCPAAARFGARSAQKGIGQFARGVVQRAAWACVRWGGRQLAPPAAAPDAALHGRHHRCLVCSIPVPPCVATSSAFVATDMLSMRLCLWCALRVSTWHSNELFYQEALRRFAQVEGRINLKKPLPLLPLVLDGLKQRRRQQQQRTRASPGGAASAAIAAQEAEGKDMVELLVSKAEMIDEYFAIRLSASGADGAAAAASEEVPVAGSEASPSAVLVTLPVLVEQYEPYWYRTVHLPSSVPAFESWHATDSSLTTDGDVVGPISPCLLSCRVARGALPDFLVALAVDVDWTEEQV